MADIVDILTAASGNYVVTRTIVALVECWGEGANGSTIASSAGRGGGGGAYSASVVKLTAGSYAYVIGQGGTGTLTNFNAGQVIADVGLTSTTQDVTNNTGGLTANGVGQVKTAGAIGGARSLTTKGGGGGGSAGTNGGGGAGTSGGSTGAGGTAGTDGGAAGGQGAVAGTPIGTVGAIPGGGGGGGGGTGGGGAGGAGARGQITISYAPAGVMLTPTAFAGVGTTNDYFLDASDIDGDASANAAYADGAKVTTWVNKGHAAGNNGDGGTGATLNTSPLLAKGMLNGLDAVDFSLGQYLKLTGSKAILNTWHGGPAGAPNGEILMALYPGSSSGSNGGALIGSASPSDTTVGFEFLLQSAGGTLDGANTLKTFGGINGTAGAAILAQTGGTAGYIVRLDRWTIWNTFIDTHPYWNIQLYGDSAYNAAPQTVSGLTPGAANVNYTVGTSSTNDAVLGSTLNNGTPGNYYGGLIGAVATFSTALPANTKTLLKNYWQTLLLGSTTPAADTHDIVIFMGDSIIQGVALDYATMPQYLSIALRALGSKAFVVNGGLSSNTATEVSSRWTSNYKPYFAVADPNSWATRKLTVIIEGGVNDAGSLNLTSYNNLKVIADDALKLGVNVRVIWMRVLPADLAAATQELQDAMWIGAVSGGITFPGIVNYAVPAGNLSTAVPPFYAFDSVLATYDGTLHQGGLGPPSERAGSSISDGQPTLKHTVAISPAITLYGTDFTDYTTYFGGGSSQLHPNDAGMRAAAIALAPHVLGIGGTSAAALRHRRYGVGIGIGI